MPIRSARLCDRTNKVLKTNRRDLRTRIEALEQELDQGDLRNKGLLEALQKTKKELEALQKTKEALAKTRKRCMETRKQLRQQQIVSCVLVAITTLWSSLHL
jgi:chromosome segregation ATPase